MWELSTLRSSNVRRRWVYRCWVSGLVEDDHSRTSRAAPSSPDRERCFEHWCGANGYTCVCNGGVERSRRSMGSSSAVTGIPEATLSYRRRGAPPEGTGVCR